MSALRYTVGQWWVALFIGTLVLIGPGNVEGRFFPAAAPMGLTGAEAAASGMEVLFWGESSRLRPACNYRDIKWYLGHRGQRNVPLKVATGPAQVREDGDFSFGPWRLDVPSTQTLTSFTFADVYHQCSVWGIQLPWQTRSAFWN